MIARRHTATSTETYILYRLHAPDEDDLDPAVAPRGPPGHHLLTFPILQYEHPPSSTKAFLFFESLYNDSIKKAMSSLCDILAPLDLSVTALCHGATVPLHCVCWALYGVGRCDAVRWERDCGQAVN